MISRFYKANKELVDKQYRIFKSKVNMTYAEMVAWKKNKCSRAASLDPLKVINRVTRLLKKPKVTWTKKDYEDSKMVTSYNSRSVKITESSIPAKPKWGCYRGKNYYAGKNWARDDDKNRKKRKNPSKKITSSLIYDLANAFYFGDPVILSIAIQQYYQGEETCDDCGEMLGMCECERCVDCNYNRCLCDIDKLTNEQVSKKAAKFAKEILNDDDWKRFNVMIGKIRENYKKLYGIYLDEQSNYWGWWKK